MRLTLRVWGDHPQVFTPTFDSYWTISNIHPIHAGDYTQSCVNELPPVAACPNAVSVPVIQAAKLLDMDTVLLDVRNEVPPPRTLSPRARNASHLPWCL
jgi:hypothetical protein